LKSGKGLTITKISDMEGNPASTQMVRALAGRVDAVIREMGLSAKIIIGHANNQKRVRVSRRTGNKASKSGARHEVSLSAVQDQGC
jgi:hypothetical protein